MKSESYEKAINSLREQHGEDEDWTEYSNELESLALKEGERRAFETMKEKLKIIIDLRRAVHGDNNEMTKTIDLILKALSIYESNGKADKE